MGRPDYESLVTAAKRVELRWTTLLNAAFDSLAAASPVEYTLTPAARELHRMAGLFVDIPAPDGAGEGGHELALFQGDYYFLGAGETYDTDIWWSNTYGVPSTVIPDSLVALTHLLHGGTVLFDADVPLTVQYTHTFDVSTSESAIIKVLTVVVQIRD
jgi:hypothetical protein